MFWCLCFAHRAPCKSCHFHFRWPGSNLVWKQDMRAAQGSRVTGNEGSAQLRAPASTSSNVAPLRRASNGCEHFSIIGAFVRSCGRSRDRDGGPTMRPESYRALRDINHFNYWHRKRLLCDRQFVEYLPIEATCSRSAIHRVWGGNLPTSWYNIISFMRNWQKMAIGWCRS